MTNFGPGRPKSGCVTNLGPGAVDTGPAIDQKVGSHPPRETGLRSTGNVDGSNMFGGGPARLGLRWSRLDQSRVFGQVHGNSRSGRVGSR